MLPPAHFVLLGLYLISNEYWSVSKRIYGITIIWIPRKHWGPGRRQLTLLCGGHSSDPAWWPVSSWVWCNTGASIVVAVRCHGEGQGFKVSTDLFCQVGAKVGGVAVSLPFSIGKWAGAKVRSSLGVLERKPKKGFERTWIYAFIFNTLRWTSLTGPSCRVCEPGERAWCAYNLGTPGPLNPFFKLCAAGPAHTAPHSVLMLSAPQRVICTCSFLPDATMHAVPFTWNILSSNFVYLSQFIIQIWLKHHSSGLWGHDQICLLLAFIKSTIFILWLTVNFFICFLSFSCICAIWKFLGQGLKPSCSCDLCHSRNSCDDSFYLSAWLATGCQIKQLLLGVSEMSIGIHGHSGWPSLV